MTRLRDARVLITGAAGGLGRALARQAADRGADLLLCDLDAERLHQLRDELSHADGEHRVRAFDIRDPDRTREGIAELADGRPVDVVINNAAVVGAQPLHALDPATVRRTVETDLLGPLWVLRSVLPEMRERGSGHLVTIASAAGLAGAERLSDYAAAKAGLIAVDDCLRAELRDHPGIRTTLVCPYVLDTALFAGFQAHAGPLLRTQNAGQVATRILDAIERDRRRLLIPGFLYTVFLARLLPVSWFDRLMSALGLSDAMRGFRGRSRTADTEDRD